MDVKIRELTDNELVVVNGGDDAGMAFSTATNWASTVAGGAVGAVVKGGIRSMVFGGVVGFAVGTAVSIGYYLATKKKKT